MPIASSSPPSRVSFQFESKPNDQLYVKLGGEKAIDTFAECMYELVIQDELLKPFFRNLDMNRQITMFSKFLQHIFGRKPYNGTQLRTAHERLGLRDKHFNKIICLLGEAMGSLGVPPDLVKEALEVAVTTRNDICGKPLPNSNTTYW
jgi:hemoglobin